MVWGGRGGILANIFLSYIFSIFVLFSLKAFWRDSKYLNFEFTSVNLADIQYFKSLKLWTFL